MELLDQWSKQRPVDPELWSHMMQFLKLSFEVDEGGKPGASLQGEFGADSQQHSGGMV